MRINRSKINLMPLIQGPLWDQKDVPRHIYTSTETLMLQYETDPEAIPLLIPEPFKPAKLPTVTVLFVDNNGVDFMAGGGYRLGGHSFSGPFCWREWHLWGGVFLV